MKLTPAPGAPGPVVSLAALPGTPAWAGAKLQWTGPTPAPAAYLVQYRRAGTWTWSTASGDAQQISSLSPSLAVDTTAKAASKDGNTVQLEQELMRMNQNAMTHNLETQMVSNMLAKMRLAITGH